MPDVYIHKEDKPDEEPMQKDQKQVTHEDPVDRENMPGHTHNPLATFCCYPHDVGFIDKEPDEEVVLLVRRHISTNLGWLVLVILMLFAPFVLNYFPLLNFLPLKFQTVAVLFWYLLSLAIFIQGFLSWFFSVNLVTNLRVIDVDFENLIYRKVTDAKLENIEDVTVQMGSVVRTVFDFGDVLIQTAAEIPEVQFWAVPHPDKIDKILSELRLEVKSS